jgi:hypothetical protein
MTPDEFDVLAKVTERARATGSPRLRFLAEMAAGPLEAEWKRRVGAQHEAVQRAQLAHQAADLELQGVRAAIEAAVELGEPAGLLERLRAREAEALAAELAAGDAVRAAEAALTQAKAGARGSAGASSTPIDFNTGTGP